jgi:hypothetical protein
MTANILEIKRKAISLLTTVYKMEDEGQVAELEIKIKDLLHTISPHPDPDGETTTDIEEKSTVPMQDIPLGDDTEPHIGEITKPLKEFAERRDSDAKKQVSYLEDAMTLRKKKRLQRFGLDKPLEKLQDMRTNRTNNINRRSKIRGQHTSKDDVPGMVDTSKGKGYDNDSDDLSSIDTGGTEPTCVSLKERMAEAWRVRRVVDGSDQQQSLHHLVDDEPQLRSWRWLQRA